MPDYKEMTVAEMRHKLESFKDDEVVLVRLGFPEGTPAEFIAAVITQIAVAHPSDLEGAVPIWSSQPEERMPAEFASEMAH